MPRPVDLVGTFETAEILGISRAHVSTLIRSGKLPTIGRLKRAHVLRRSDVLRYAAKRGIDVRPPAEAPAAESGAA